MKTVFLSILFCFFATAEVEALKPAKQPSLKDLMPQPNEVIVSQKAKNKITMPDNKNPLLKGSSCKDKFGTWKPGQPEFEQCRMDYQQKVQPDSRYQSALPKATQEAMPQGLKDHNTTSVEVKLPITDGE